MSDKDRRYVRFAVNYNKYYDSNFLILIGVAPLAVGLFFLVRVLLGFTNYFSLVPAIFLICFGLYLTINDSMVAKKGN